MGLRFDSNRLRDLRRRRALSIRDLVERTGCSKWAIRAWQRGQAEPLPENVRRLAAALEVGPEELFVEEGRVSDG